MVETLESPNVMPEIQKRRLAAAARYKKAPPVREKRGGTGEVLVVEDTPDIRRLMKIVLETFGMQVTMLGDGQSAADMIDMNQAPDLVIMDRMLPYVSGDKLIEKIRADQEWNEVPVVVVSAKARGSDVAESLHSGANDYVTKPFNSKHFMEVVSRYV
ncbi:MAG: response regulator [Burkholderiaceae bacterium]